MFESKNIADKRLGTLESIVNQLILNQEAVLKRRSPLAVAVARMAVRYPELQQDLQAFESERESDLENLYRLMDQWSYVGQRYKDQEAARVIGFRPTEEDADRWASKKWIECLLRANGGLLECFGEGRHNLNADLPGNDTERYSQWLGGLENLTNTISDTRQSSILRDNVQGHAEAFGGIPVYFINAGDFLHVIAMTNVANIQSLSVKHLPADWTWDRPEAWRAEMFSYLGNLSKETFIVEFAKALAVDGRNYFYLPEEFAGEYEADMALVQQAAAAAGLAMVPAEMGTDEDVAAKAAIADEAANDDVETIILAPNAVVNRMPWLFDETVDTSKLGKRAVTGTVNEMVYPFPAGKTIDVIGASVSEALVTTGEQDFTDSLRFAGIQALYCKRDDVESGAEYDVVHVDYTFTESELSQGKASFTTNVNGEECEVAVEFDGQFGTVTLTSDNPSIVAFSVIGLRVNFKRVPQEDAHLED